MENQDTTLRLSVIHGMEKCDAEQHWFTCEAIWSVKRIHDEEFRIQHLETTFRDITITLYMKYKAIVSTRQTRSLARIKRDMLREFQNPNLESQCIIEINEIKKKTGETIWDYDQRFNIFLDRLMF
jgi:hypothetical protein